MIEPRSPSAVGIRIGRWVEQHREVDGQCLSALRGVLAVVGVAGVVAYGILCGVVAALALGRALSSVLFGLTANDPITFLATAIALLATATLACWLPARRATRINPSLTLREG